MALPEESGRSREPAPEGPEPAREVLGTSARRALICVHRSRAKTNVGRGRSVRLGWALDLAQALVLAPRDLVPQERRCLDRLVVRAGDGRGSAARVACDVADRDPEPTGGDAVVGTTPWLPTPAPQTPVVGSAERGWPGRLPASAGRHAGSPAGVGGDVGVGVEVGGRAATCPSRSARRSRSCTPNSSMSVRSLPASGVRRRRSHASCGATRPTRSNELAYRGDDSAAARRAGVPVARGWPSSLMDDRGACVV
jgi:hypothetical protein